MLEAVLYKDNTLTGLLGHQSATFSDCRSTTEDVNPVCLFSREMPEDLQLDSADVSEVDSRPSESSPGLYLALEAIF